MQTEDEAAIQQESRETQTDDEDIESSTTTIQGIKYDPLIEETLFNPSHIQSVF